MRDVIGITVDRALELPEIENLEIVAGKNGLDRKITKINIMEVPDIIDWVEEGEVLFTTLYSISDDEEALKNLIPGLAEKKLAGLAVKPGRYVREIPEFMKVQADRYDLPLLEIPYEYSFSELINAILQEIVKVQTEFLEKTLKIHEELTDIALAHKGLKKLASQLSQRTGNPILFIDYSGEIMAESFPEEMREGLKREGFVRSARQEIIGEEDIDSFIGYYSEKEITIQNDKFKQFKLPIKSGKNNFGFLYTWEIYSSINLLEINTLEWAATIAVLDILNRKELAEVKRRYKNELLHDIIEGEITDKETMLKRIEHMGLDLQGERMVIIIDTKKIVNKYMMEEGLPYRESVQDRIYSVAQQESPENSVTCILGSYVVVIFPVTQKDFSNNREQVENYLQEIKLILPPEYFRHLKIGVGNRVSDVRRLQESFRQAERAVFVAEKFADDSDESGAFFYQNLGIYKLFYQVKDEDLNGFIENILQPLLDYDRENDSEMLKTLDAYFRTGGNLSEVADELYIHYNTVGYRMERIEKITGMDLDSPDDRLNLEIALKLNKIYARD